MVVVVPIELEVIVSKAPIALSDFLQQPKRVPMCPYNDPSTKLAWKKDEDGWYHVVNVKPHPGHLTDEHS